MNIIPIHIYNTKLNNSSNSRKKCLKADISSPNDFTDKLSFTGNNYNHKVTIMKLNNRLEKELNRLRELEENFNQHNIDTNKRIERKQDIIEKMSELTEEYRLINEMLSTKTKGSTSYCADIAVDFVTAMNNLGLDKGFNRISGYKDIKKFLKSKFIFSAILKDKINENANVPNTLLF